MAQADTTQFDFRHTRWSRTQMSKHRLCNCSAGATRPALILLRALHKAVPADFGERAIAPYGPTPARDRTDDYFALFPTTVNPLIFTMDTETRYPRLKATPSTFRKR
ncbi:hypothetical protein V8C34DRAFT_277576 [Trichoderma compactum]